MERSSQNTPATGKVYLVGAGPGAPGLLTIRGQECLREADVVLYDGLANSELLRWAPTAKHHSVGKHGQIPHWTQADINQHMVELALAGNTVVRLKGGDPAVFARTAEELDALVQANIPFEVVPGITAALAAASFVGIPITHRDHASAVAFITGQQKPDDSQDLSWDAVARFPGTLVFYMGVTTVKQWTERLLAEGKPASTPAAIIRRCTWSDQEVIRCQLKDVATVLTPASAFRPPVIVILGDVAALGDDFDWFSQKELLGNGILLTRPEGQNAELASSLRNLGADIFEHPALRISSPVDSTQLDRARLLLTGNEEIRGITFSSANGVHFLMRYLQHHHLDSRVFARLQLAGVGPSVDDALRQYGLRCDVMPSEAEGYSAVALANTIVQACHSGKWLVTTTNRSKGTLQRILEDQGNQVVEVLCYESQSGEACPPEIVDAISKKRIQWCTVTSSAIADAIDCLLGDAREELIALALSPAIARRLEEHGWQHVVQAEQNTANALLDAIRSHASR